MSADNGIYILESPSIDGKEYRVAYAMAIDNINYNNGKAVRADGQIYSIGDCYKILIFSKSKIYPAKHLAKLEASIEAKKWPHTEYGICVIKDTKPFPKITYNRATKIINR